jgi:hypothetical protein
MAGWRRQVQCVPEELARFVVLGDARRVIPSHGVWSYYDIDAPAPAGCIRVRPVRPGR